MPTRLRWLGHAALEIVHGETRILIDPFLSENPAAACKPDSLEAHYIVVTHGHGDHVGDTVAIARRNGATVISNYEITTWLQAQGVEKVHPMNTGGGHAFPFGRLKLTPAWHTSMLPDGSYGGTPAGVLLQLRDGPAIYDAADTGLFGDMRLIGEEGVDLAILPIGDNFTMGPDDALRAVKLIEPRKVMPIHFNTWDLIAQDPEAWAHRVRQQTSAEPVILAPGGSLDL
jgi:L-ascorbate metabolism protein UlaG (beta-lactamase superfamily)